MSAKEETKRERLTQKQETFCVKYFELGNATEAAITAGYSPKTVRFIASENLTKPNIQARIQELRQKSANSGYLIMSRASAPLMMLYNYTRRMLLDRQGFKARLFTRQGGCTLGTLVLFTPSHEYARS